MIIPAMIGGAALLADGVLTPAVTVTTAIEGLRGIPQFFDRFGNNQNVIVIITLVIIFVLFMVQRFGTDIVGKAFGPIMFAWFTFLGVMGLLNFSQDWTVIRALNPYYAIQLLFSAVNKLGLFILGNIFLATTGAEALYSDLGHVGKRNIRLSWPYVKICLVINYFGQAAWLLNIYQNPEAQQIKNLQPYPSVIPILVRCSYVKAPLKDSA
ncbi:KUP/HAK/KT family potassium transporter [Listeria innocua]